MDDAFHESDTPNNIAKSRRVLDSPMELPYNVHFSTDPCNNHLTHSVSTFSTQKTLGSDLCCNDLTGILQLFTYLPCNPGKIFKMA